MQIWMLAVMLSAAGAERPSWDVPLTGSSGAQVWLSDHVDRPVVLFYEDRDSADLNQPLKDELFARGKERGLLGAVQVIAVANLGAWDWFPARDFALRGVRDAERKFNIPILIDWDGTLARPPWKLPPATSSVLVLDPAGRVVMRRSGALSAKEREELFATLERLLAG